MQDYSKGSVGIFITVYYNVYVEACMQGSKGMYGQCGALHDGPL
jgi:hypothetical protein